MSADWDEVKRLAADFQRAQLSSTVQRLSERNCIEIVKKLIELKLIDVIFTNDGKEYLTPNRLLKEIKDELFVNGGRINLVDLAQIIGVDFNHVEAKAAEVVQTEEGVRLVLGQLITSDYLDHIAEEINEKLHQAGEITIAELTKIYDLPGNFLEEVVHNRLGTIILGQVDSNDSRTFFTDSFLAQHTARIRGALSALTRPIPTASIISHFKFPEKLFYHVAEDLIKEGRLAASISGGRSERSIFLPDVYAKSQNEWVDSFYNQNGYLEYDALTRLGIQDPKAYIRKKFKDESLTYLNSCCIGSSIFGQVEATIEEVLNGGNWVDIMPILPSVFSTEDCRGIINAVTKSLTKQSSLIHIYCDTIVISDDFLKSCQSAFAPLMTSKAQEDIKKPQLFAAAQSSKTVNKKESLSKGKQDRKEEKKKRVSAGKSGGGFSSQGRETKTKAVKKKYFTSKDVEDSGSDDDTSSSHKEFRNELEFITVEGIENHLKKLELCQDCPEELISELSYELHRPLTKKYQEVAEAMYLSTVASSGNVRRKQHADCQEKFSSLLNHISMFEKGTKIFSDDITVQLCKHLLKSLCTDLCNMIIIYLAQEHGLSTGSEDESSLSAEQRQKMINKFSDDIKCELVKLNTSLSAKNLDDFLSSVHIVLGAGMCDMVIKKLDKKKERLIISNHKQSLLQQLNESSDPALCLHLAVLLIFQSHTHTMLHASGKFVPHIIAYLQKQVPLDTYQMLATYQEMVIKKITSGEEGSNEMESALHETMPKIKECAVLYKKSSISETEN
ncbi:E3 UFM1-protein ligase 1-like [Uloborus diversus]|uniref:E3 UFM1-protein ligase 1-like n=1 Tax=Uloborus diversus TaxID=327109 RepID=UPI00240A75CA|nr:E3 UFM1-protein ligase 1-like [Uloborus diversus]